MKASELIRKLQEIVSHEADFEVMVDPGPDINGRDDTVFKIDYVDHSDKYIWIGVLPERLK